MQVEQKYFVGIQDVGAGYRMHNKAMLEAMTNTANIHANTVGQGTDDLESSGLTWVVANWKLQVLRRPKVCSTVTVRTWAQAYSRAQARRECEILDEKGERLAIATSVWAAVDTGRGSIIRLTPELMEGYGCEPERENFPGYQFPKTGKNDLPVLAQTSVKVSRFMIDCNHHVHNPAYLDLANEVLPEELDAGLFDNVEISYKREIPPRAEVSLAYAREEDRHIVLLRDPEDRALHARITLY